MVGKIVEKGDIVRFSYVGRLEDGSIFDTSDDPISVEIGTGKLIVGLDKEIMGMTEGEEKEIKVSPEEGYGLENPGLIAMIPHEAFKKNNIEPQVGMMLKTPQGHCHITAVSDEDVEVNFNHPLAGKTLIFDVKVKEIIKK
jgi:FKBP-type peptidyl-prolyl cis-trans isomerase 2